MIKFLAPIVALMLVVTSLYGLGGHARLASGTLTFTFQPQNCGGTDGTWQAVVIPPDGERNATDPVAFNSTDPVSIEVSCEGSDFLEVGAYGIELINNIEGASAPFLSSITVQCTCPDLSWDTITYRDMPTMVAGDNTVIYYVVPAKEK